MKYTILVTNDDGMFGPGLKPLVRALQNLGTVITVVPDQERSASSHAITLHKPLRVRKTGPGTFAANGTPADCVRFAALAILRRKADLVVSGINAGPNLGQDVVYSGTVAGAREGALLGIPSLAVSVSDPAKYDFNSSARIARRLAGIILSRGDFPGRIYWNVNVPARPKGMRITSLGLRIYDESIECRTDLRGQKYYWMGGKNVTGINKPGTDLFAVAHGFVSVTPLQLDPTAVGLLPEFEQWIKNSR